MIHQSKCRIYLQSRSIWRCLLSQLPMSNMLHINIAYICQRFTCRFRIRSLMFIWIFWHLTAIRIRIRNHLFGRSKMKWHSIAHAYIALKIRVIVGRDAKKFVSRNWIMSVSCQVETSTYKILHIFVRFRCIFSAISLLFTVAFCLPWQWVNAQ